MSDSLFLQLQPASFRGVPFFVRGASASAGRRVQEHQYPQRDEPWSEDLGMAMRENTVEGVVVGPSYVADANALLDAAEIPGPGTLVHPWFGSMEVTLRDGGLHVSFDEAAGEARISFGFIRGGELQYPAAATSSAFGSRMGADGLCTAACESFSGQYSVAGFASFVSNQAGLDLSRAFSFAGSLGGVGALSGWASTLEDFAGQALQYLADPLALAQQVMDWFDLSPLVSSLVRGSAANATSLAPTYAAAVSTTTLVTPPLTAMALNIVALAGNGGAGGVLNAPLPSPTATPARRQLVANTAAINGLVRRALLAQAVGISGFVDTTVQADAHRLRNDLCAALDAESLVADDVAYAALQTARRAVWTDLTARASGGARLVPLTPAEVSPALVLAYDRYEDATRESEIVARNNLVHPGFVPMRPLQVLSK